jgi:cold shock CspA family protein/ribosome-associated translation inhibitor RaiA
MDVPLEIAFHNLATSEALERRIRERVARMDRRYGRISSCRIVVEAPHRSPENAREYRVRIEARVPERELVVSRAPGTKGAHFDPYIVVRDAFDAMERQLEQHAQKIRGDTKHHPTPLQGRVLRTFADHGFVATNDGREVYFHRNAVPDGGFERLEQDTPVELTLVHGESPAGPQATTVRPIRPMEYVAGQPHKR